MLTIKLSQIFLLCGFIIVADTAGKYLLFFLQLYVNLKKSYHSTRRKLMRQMLSDYFGSARYLTILAYVD